MSRVTIKAPIRDKPCLASATTTFGRVLFFYDTSGYLSGLQFYGEDTTTEYFRLRFRWVSGRVSGITRMDNPRP